MTEDRSGIQRASLRLVRQTSAGLMPVYSLGQSCAPVANTTAGGP